MADPFVLILRYDTGTELHLEWTQSLGSDRNQTRRDFHEALEAIHGVETVVMRRWSAVIEFAPHVTDFVQVGQDLQDVVQALGAALGQPVQVTSE